MWAKKTCQMFEVVTWGQCHIVGDPEDSGSSAADGSGGGKGGTVTAEETRYLHRNCILIHPMIS